MQLEDISVGDVVEVMDAWGTGPLLVGTVVEIEEDIKNGEPGISYDLHDGHSKWAYLYQVKKVVKFEG